MWVRMIGGGEEAVELSRMLQLAFGLFVDVMGVQQDFLLTDEHDEALTRFNSCRERLKGFHTDLESTIAQELWRSDGGSKGAVGPVFVAEFSDSAYVVSEHFASVASIGASLMRKALRHEYPLRGGIGVGTFAHETSGARVLQNGQIWSTSSFLGGAIVSAYHAEQNGAPGMRVFIHPQVMATSADERLTEYAIPLGETESNDKANSELRFWSAVEAPLALERLYKFRDKQRIPDRAAKHYDASAVAYKRFASAEGHLPDIVPAFWL